MKRTTRLVPLWCPPFPLAARIIADAKLVEGRISPPHDERFYDEMRRLPRETFGLDRRPSRVVLSV